MHNEKLKKARERAGLTQTSLARQAGVTLASYQRFEYGTRRPSLDTAFKIADVLDTSVDKLFRK